ncbi:MAG TPA: hypothetical protein VJJ72_01350 [Candidatus Paceibacterota bacterium]
MRKDKEKATQLRRAGMSYKQIKRELDIPIGTLASWFGHEPWSQEIRDKLGALQSFSFPEKLAAISKSNKERWAKWHSECQEEAIREFPKLKKDFLFLAGLMLYWGEGDKVLRNGIVRLANSDPNMIKIFYLFLLGPLAVPKEKIFLSLLLYPDLIDNIQKNFWSKSTGISLEQFKKTVYIKGRHPTKRLSYGVCNINVFSRKLKEKILKWTHLYQNFLNSKYGHLA